MNDITLMILKLVVTVSVFVITNYLVPWLKLKLGAEKVATAEKLVEQAVRWIQQISENMSGEEKKDRVLARVKEILATKGITITDEQLDVLIEAAVKEMKNAEGTWIVSTADAVKESE